jgi:replication-associated recombination protein RarA
MYFWQELKSRNLAFLKQDQFILFGYPEKWTKISNQNIELSAKIKKSEIKNEVEFITLDLVPQYETKIPEWINEWSFSEKDKGQSNNYYDSKTYNLQELLEDLKNLTVNSKKEDSANNSIIGRFCFIVQKK